MGKSWPDPDFLAAAPLAALVKRGRGYVEAGKEVVLAEHWRILPQVIPLHRRLWEEGRIEVTTTPLAHPILPLIADTDFALAGDPTARLPERRYREIIDADQQVIRGLDVAERLLGRRPAGMWPAEGAVAQLVMSLVSKNGVRWVATGEDVLARSLGLSITRDGSDTVEQSELYRPWQATLRRNAPVPIFFRDVRISDLIGFEYSGMTGGAAAADFMRRLRAIRDRLDAEGRLGGALPPGVSVILDGENAWEHYANDGKDFLRALYRRLEQADWVATITPSEYLQRFAEPEPLGECFPPPGSSPTSPPGSARKRRRWPGTNCGGCATTCAGRSDRAGWQVRRWPPPTRPCCSPRARTGSGGTAPTRSPATTATSTARSGSCWARCTTASAGNGRRSCRCRSSRRRRSRWCASRMRRRR